MPEMTFRIRWPDGASEVCYSPSLIIKDYFDVGQTYTLDDFRERACTALMIASDRVKAEYGVPCSRALAQLHRIETTASTMPANLTGPVLVEAFEE